MVCSICGTPKVNKASCPLVLKTPTNLNWKKHFNAQKPRVKTHIRKPQVKTLKNDPVNIINPYITIYNMYIKNVLYFKQKLDCKTSKINLSYNELLKLEFNVKRKDFKLILILNKKKREVFIQYIKLIIDTYKELSTYKCNRLDYFVNPDFKTQHLCDIVFNIKKEFTKFIVNNREYKGGNSVFVTTRPIDDIVSDLDLEHTLSTLSKINTPTIFPSIKVNTKQLLNPLSN